MTRHRLLTAIRGGSVALVLLAIAVVAVDLSGRDRFDPTRFFAFFTIQSNLIGVAAFVWLLMTGERSRPPALEALRGAAAVYLTVTFFVVIFLLSGADVQLDLVWVDVVLHKVFPLIVVLDWILDPPTVRVGARHLLIWLVYPLAWTGFTLTRGARDGWYPYPFLDPANGGYGQVALTIVAITIGFVAVSLVVIAVGNVRAAGRTPRSTGAGRGS
jgi:hypothetical protein